MPKWQELEDTAGEGNGNPLQFSHLEKSHGQRNLVGCSPWGCEESEMTERLHFDFSLSRIGEGNGNPLQCSCLENPRDGGAWWAAVYGFAQSQTWLKRLSSSSMALVATTLFTWGVGLLVDGTCFLIDLAWVSRVAVLLFELVSVLFSRVLWLNSLFAKLSLQKFIHIHIWKHSNRSWVLQSRCVS